jgi:hypothetical protein
VPGQPGNPGKRNPWQGRAALKAKSRPKAGSLYELKVKLWGVLVGLEASFYEAENGEERRKQGLAFSQVSGVYVKLHEVAEIQPQIDELRETIREWL